MPPFHVHRPEWDSYFLKITHTVAERADCTRRQVGAVLVKDHRIVATGYNGAPAGKPGCLSDHACPRGRHFRTPPKRTQVHALCYCGNVWPCPKAAEPGSSYDTGASACIALHAEQNVLLYSSRDGSAGSTLYVTDHPCDGCLRMIRGSGVTRCVTPGGDVAL